MGLHFAGREPRLFLRFALRFTHFRLLFCSRAAAAASFGGGLFGGAAVAFGGFAVRAVDEAVGPERSVGVFCQTHADEKIAVGCARGHRHKPASRLGQPLAERERPAANRTDGLVCRHRCKRVRFVRIPVAHMARQTARKLRAVKAVFMFSGGLLIGGDAAGKIEPAANDRRVIRVSKRVVRRARGLDAHHLHGGRERLLRA